MDDEVAAADQQRHTNQHRDKERHVLLLLSFRWRLTRKAAPGF
jgi:hypothetical protein